MSVQEQQPKKTISLKVMATPDADPVKRLEAEQKMLLESQPPLSERDWGKIRFVVSNEGSLYHRAQLARFQAVLGVFEEARNLGGVSRADDYLAWDLYVSTVKDAHDYLFRAQYYLGELDEEEAALMDDTACNAAERLVRYNAWLRRRREAAAG